MEKDTVNFYRSDNLANAAMASFIANNDVVDAKQVTFTEDDYYHDFVFIGMEEREWWGMMCGIRLTTREGKMVIFASWEDGSTVPYHESISPYSWTSDFAEEYTYEKAFAMFIRALSSMN